jgi:hypothetical protein
MKPATRSSIIHARKMRSLVLLHVTGVIARPLYWNQNYGCNALLSTQSLGVGMLNSGSGYANQADGSTSSLSNGVYSITMPSGSWFVTAAAGSFGGTGSTAGGCATFRYDGSTTGLTWTPPSAAAGTYKIEVGYAGGNNQVINWYTHSITIAAASMLDYSLLSSAGSCGTVITDFATCSAAASALALPDTTATAASGYLEAGGASRLLTQPHFPPPHTRCARAAPASRFGACAHSRIKGELLRTLVMLEESVASAHVFARTLVLRW